MTSHQILQLYPDAKSLQDFVLQDDGKGPYIRWWNERIGPRPTPEQLAAVAAEAEAAENLAEIRSSRAAAYPPIGDQLDNIWKALAYLKASGVSLGPDGEAGLAAIEAVKTALPKPV